MGRRCIALSICVAAFAGVVGVAPAIAGQTLNYGANASRTMALSKSCCNPVQNHSD